MNVLGISSHYHDSAAALLVDGKPTAAVQEERLSRRKHDASFPAQAVAFCLGQTVEPPDAVVYYEKPLRRFERILSTALLRAPRGFQLFRHALPMVLKEKLWVLSAIREAVPGAREYLFAPHHLSHAASAFFPSPFDRAAVLTVDGVGEWATCSFGVGNGSDLTLLGEQRFPHSIGLLYSAFTAYLGFRVNDGEYKVMGLAPYGTPRFLDLILGNLVSMQADGAFSLNLDCFAFRDRLSMTNDAFHRLFGGGPRPQDGELTQRHMDIASSIQKAAEILLLGLVRHVHRETGEENLCMAGGVALNCVANSRILQEGPFRRVWIQPAAGDAGGALGAAFLGYTALGGRVPPKAGEDLMEGSLLGPSYPDKAVEDSLGEAGIPFRRLGTEALVRAAVRALASGRVVGWFQGPAEFGPRALGARSILADPRVPGMQRTLNRKVKFRESFRPFGPSVLRERAGEYFDLLQESRYMLLVAQVAEDKMRSVSPEPEGIDRIQVVRSVIPAVTHVDGSARIQTVGSDGDPLFYRLLKGFEEETGCPMLVNTSFNLKDEPIVLSPRDAVECYNRTGIDALAAGHCWTEKEEAT